MKLRNKPRRKLQNALSLIELVALLAVVALIALVMVLRMTRIEKGAKRIPCVNNLKNIGLAFSIFATENNDHSPVAVIATNGIELTSVTLLQVIRSLSNHLSTPKILHCPSDRQRDPALHHTNFATLTPRNISYFASLSASEQHPGSFLAGDRNILTNGKPIPGLLALTTNLAPTLAWSKEIHVEQGNFAMGDSSVQSMSSSRLRQSIRDRDLQTNYLAFP